MEASLETSVETAYVSWDGASRSYEGTPVIQAEQLQTPEERKASQRAMERRDNPSLARTLLALNIGVICCALAYVLFQSPNNFDIGGSSGLSLVLAAVVPGLSQNTALWIVNIALVAVGLALADRKAVLLSVVATIGLSLYSSLFEWLLADTGVLGTSLTGDTWLDLCCTILLVSAGNAIAFNAGASTGGTEILVLVLTKRTSLEVSHAITCANVVAVAAGVALFGLRTGMYCVVGLLMQTVVVGGLLDDLKCHKICTVICKQPARVEEFVVRELARTATVTRAYGAYSGEEVTMVMTVLSRPEAQRLQSFLHELDPTAFITYVSTSEITGQGFRWV